MKYEYDRVDNRRMARLGYHWHDLAGETVFHAHCGPLDASLRLPERDHLRATEISLLEAHTEFMRLYAGDTLPDCSTFRPLEVRR